MIQDEKKKEEVLTVEYIDPLTGEFVSREVTEEELAELQEKVKPSSE